MATKPMMLPIRMIMMGSIAWVAALPDRDDRLTIAYDLDYGDSPYLRPQTFTCHLTPETFRDSISPSRTFVLESEIEEQEE